MLVQESANVMDEDHDELRFVCKLCDKRFPSGKSLGGHMRSHVVAAAAAVAVVAANSDESDDKFEVMKEHDNGNLNLNSSSYGLRENPKKSWRASSSSTTLPNEKTCNCKQCGKVFQSMKALCGHMAFHSDKDRTLKDHDYSYTSGSDSDTDENELQDPVFVTRSKSKGYNKVVTKPCSLSLTNTNSTNSNYNYGSSSVSELDEFEQEDVAMCLMMLSKDSANWGGVNSVVESSDNTSVELETKLCSVEMKNSNEVKGFNYKDLSYEEKQEIRRNLFREFGYDSSLNKRIRDDDNDDDDSYKKRNKYECLNCNKVFSSFQGLGGHRPCHKKNHAFIAGGNSFERNQKTRFEKKIRPKKNKGHECPICFRMFKSGQALGGHKRSHFINGSEDRIDHMAAIEQVGATYTDMIDLNLPAPEED